MAGKYITVPGNQTYSGRPERRYQMPDGEIRLTGPNMTLRDILNLGAFNDPRYYEQGNKPQPVQPAPVVKDASGRDDQGADLDMEFIRGLKDESASSLPPSPSVPLGGNPLSTTPIVDRNAERDAVYKQMMQQYGGNTAQEAFGFAPRSNEIGYSDRADIQAWMQANAGTPMVEKFMAEQRAKGLVNEGQQLTMPQGDSPEAVESREQAARIGRDGRTMLQAAQSAVNSVQSDEIAKLRASEAQNEALQFGNKIGEPGAMNRMQLFGMQNVSEQLQKSENSYQQGMQPFSARAAEVGVELADPFDLFNRPMNGKNFLDLYRVRP